MNKSMKTMLRRILALIMCAVMMAGMAPEVMLKAFGMEAGSVYAEESVTEEKAEAKQPTKVVVAHPYQFDLDKPNAVDLHAQPEALTAYYSYTDGVLTMKKGMDGIKHGWMYEFDPDRKANAVIYADGDLTLELANGEDDKLYMSFDVSSYASSEVKEVYGIYVDGDLTIRNAGGKSGGLDMVISAIVSSMGSNVTTAAGIYCTGKLTIEEQNGGKLTISGIKKDYPEYQPGENVQNDYAIYAGNGIDIKGGTINVTSGDVSKHSGRSFGIYSADGGMNISGGDITATGGKISGSDTMSAGVFVDDLDKIREAQEKDDPDEAYCNYYIEWVGGLCGYSELRTTTLNMTGGTLRTNGGDKTAGELTEGLYTPNLCISGGEISSTSGKISSGNTYGARITHNFDLTDGKLSATGGDATVEGESYYSWSTGVRCDGIIDISGGELRGKGGKITGNGDSEGIGSSGNVAVKDGELYAFGGAVTGSKGQSKGLIVYGTGGKATINGGMINVSAGDAPEVSSAISVNLKENLFIDKAADCYSEVGTAAKSFRAEERSTDSEINFTNANHVFGGLFAYSDGDGGVELKKISASTEDNYGLPADLYNNLSVVNATATEGVKTTNHSFAEEVAVGTLFGLDNSLASEYRFYVGSVSDLDDDAAGEADWDELVAGGKIRQVSLTDKVRMGGNTDLTLSYVPKNTRFTLKSVDITIPVPESGSTYSSDDFDGSDTTIIRKLMSLYCGRMDMSEGDVFSSWKTYTAKIRLSAPVDSGYDLQPGVTVVKINGKEHQLQSEIGAYYVEWSFVPTGEVPELRTFTLHANGGKFIYSADVMKYANDMMYKGIIGDFDKEVYECGEDAISFTVLADITWMELFNGGIYEAMTERGIFSGKSVDERTAAEGLGLEVGGIIRYGYVLDVAGAGSLDGFITHEGELTAEDAVLSATITANPDQRIPAQYSDLYLAWKPGNDISMDFLYDADLFDIEAPEGVTKTEHKKGDVVLGCTLTAPQNTLLVFPEISSDSVKFKSNGWLVGGTDSEGIPLSAGTGASLFFRAGLMCEADTKLLVDSLTFTADNVPAQLTADKQASDYTITPDGSGNPGLMQVQFCGFTTQADNHPENCPVNGAFENNKSYYALFNITLSNKYTYDSKDISVKLNGEELIVRDPAPLNGQQFFAYKKFRVGSVASHTLSFDIGERNDLLPAWAKDGIVFEEGDTIQSVLSEKRIEELQYIEYADDDYVYRVDWHEDAESISGSVELQVYELETKTGDVTLYGSFNGRKLVKAADFTLAIPEYGMAYQSSAVPEASVYELQPGYSGDEIAYNFELYTNRNLSMKMASGDSFRDGRTYYIVCNIYQSKGLPGHVSPELYPEKLPTVTLNGAAMELLESEGGGYYFVYPVSIYAPHDHDMIHHPAVAATATTEGNIEYWECSICHKFFSDESGTNEITTADTEIEAPEATAVTLSENKISVRIGEEKALKAEVAPENAKDKSLSWSSSNEKVVTVDKDGKIKGIWSGSAKIAVSTVNGKTATCEVTVEKAFADDTEGQVHISPEDFDTYVFPELQEHKPVTAEPVSVKLKGGSVVSVSVSANYMNAVSYTGKAVKPAEDLQAVFELDDILMAAGVSGVKAEEIFKVTYVSKNKNAGAAKFYAKISLVKGAKKKFRLSKDQEKDLKAILKVQNKAMKNNPISFTINKASLVDLAEVSLHAKFSRDGKLKVKSGGKISGFKNVKIKYKPTDKKAVTLSAKAGYSYTVTDAETCKVKLSGNKNFTGSKTVIAVK